MNRGTRIIRKNLQFQLLLHLQQKKKDRAASRANTQPSSKYFSVCNRFIPTLCFVYTLNYENGNSVISFNIKKIKKSYTNKDIKNIISKLITSL